VVSPTAKYPTATSCNVLIRLIILCCSKKSLAWFAVNCTISTIFLPLYVCESASSEYLVPPHASHVTVTGSAKSTSGCVTPFPLQTGHAPIELKLNNPGGSPLALANVPRDRKSVVQVRKAGIGR